MPRHGCFLLALLLLLPGCGQGNANGVRITERGVFLNDAEHNRIDTEKTIVEHFTKDLGPHWTMVVTIAPNPRLIEARNDLDSEFRWNEVSVAVALTGNGLQNDPPVPETQIRDEIIEFLHKPEYFQSGCPGNDRRYPTDAQHSSLRQAGHRSSIHDSARGQQLHSPSLIQQKNKRFLEEPPIFSCMTQ